MPSFDTVSEVDIHQLTNAVDQANRVVANRFDFKGVEASFEREERVITITSEAEFQLQQMEDMLRSALVKCDIDPMAMEVGDITTAGKLVKQHIALQHGLDSMQCKKIGKLIKETKLKVQSQVQGDQVRVTAKKRDDLQRIMQILRESDLGQPLQFTNFRD